MSYEVEVAGWRLGLLAGDWLYPEGDDYMPEPGSGEARGDGGDVWVEAPGGRVTATIAWLTGEPSFARMLDPRGPGDLGAFQVTTDVPPVTKHATEAFLRQLLPSLEPLLAPRDIR
jgi:hypothetical protein